MFEYIGEMAKDYLYSVTPLLEDALMDRDPVHRQVSTLTLTLVSQHDREGACQLTLTLTLTLTPNP